MKLIVPLSVRVAGRRHRLGHRAGDVGRRTDRIVVGAGDGDVDLPC